MSSSRVRRRLAALGALLVIAFAAIPWIRHGLHDQATVVLTGVSTWQTGPDTITIRRAEVKAGRWTGRVDPPPGVLAAVFRRVPSLREWWHLSHRQYDEGRKNTVYLSADLHVTGPNPELVVSTLRMGLVTPNGVIPHEEGHWTMHTGGLVELNVSIPVPGHTDGRPGAQAERQPASTLPHPSDRTQVSPLRPTRAGGGHLVHKANLIRPNDSHA